MNIKKVTQKDRHGAQVSIEFDTDKRGDPMMLNSLQGLFKSSVPPMDSIPHPGNPKGTDTVPAWLTPGEFVMNAEATRMFEPQIKAMNEQGKAVQRMQGGSIPEYRADGGPIVPITPEEMGMAADYIGMQRDPRALELMAELVNDKNISLYEAARRVQSLMGLPEGKFRATDEGDGRIPEYIYGEPAYKAAGGYPNQSDNDIPSFEDIPVQANLSEDVPVIDEDIDPLSVSTIGVKGMNNPNPLAVNTSVSDFIYNYTPLGYAVDATNFLFDRPVDKTMDALGLPRYDEQGKIKPSVEEERKKREEAAKLETPPEEFKPIPDNLNAAEKATLDDNAPLDLTPKFDYNGNPISNEEASILEEKVKKKVKKKAEENPGMFESAFNWFKESLGDAGVLDSGEIAKMAVFYLGSRLFGNSHEGSLNWVGTNFVNNIQAKQKAIQANELAMKKARAETLAKGYAKDSKTFYIKGQPVKAKFHDGLKEWHFQGPDGKMYVVPNDAESQDDRQTKISNINSLYSDLNKAADDEIKTSLEGMPEGEKLNASRLANQAVEFFKSKAYSIDDPDTATSFRNVFDNAMRLAVDDYKRTGKKPGSLIPYLNNSFIRTRTNMDPVAFVLNPDDDMSNWKFVSEEDQAKIFQFAERDLDKDGVKGYDAINKAWSTFKQLPVEKQKEYATAGEKTPFIAFLYKVLDVQG